MVLQARAEATRRRILDSAVDLFEESGYGETGLADVLLRANVSKGAFYYHFDSKEAMATAIIEECRYRVTAATYAKIDRSAPKLDPLITSTFVVAELLQSDKNVRVGNQLLQALSQISRTTAQIYGQWTTQFVDAFIAGVEQVGARDGVDATETAEAAWAGVLGSHLLSSALESDAIIRLVRTWRLIVRATLPDHLLDEYFGLIEQKAMQFQPIG